MLAAFVAGVVFNVVGSSEAKERQEEIQQAITRFFDLPILVLLGMTLPSEGWLELGWWSVLLALAVLLLGRLPAVLALKLLLGELKGPKDLLFLGWFGLVGAAALYYAALSLQERGTEEVWTVGSLIVCASILAHGLTDIPLTKLYGRLPRGG